MEKLKPKLFSVLKNYSKEQLVKDVVAGIIVAIIALPLSIALALALFHAQRRCAEAEYGSRTFNGRYYAENNLRRKEKLD